MNTCLTSRPERDDRHYFVAVAGARSVQGGVYIDLLIHDREVHIQQEPYRMISTAGYAADIGRSISLAEEPSQLIEMAQADGQPVTLQPMQRGEGFYLVASFCVRPAPPPFTELGPTGDGGYAIIQTCLLRTTARVEPGQYRMRLVEPGIDARYGWLWQHVDCVMVQTDWVWVEVMPALASEILR
jgi:hypothetical protein